MVPIAFPLRCLASIMFCFWGTEALPAKKVEMVLTAFTLLYGRGMGRRHHFQALLKGALAHAMCQSQIAPKLLGTPRLRRTEKA